MLRVIAYDIADNRRRRNVCDICRDYGARQQYSVFICDLSEENWNRFILRLKSAIDPELDSIAVFPLCRGCRSKQIFLGRAGPYEKPQAYIF